MGDFPDHPFWDFALKVYGGEGVAPACLALQERHGADINFVLFCCWIAGAGYGAAGRDEIARLHEAAARWHGEIVRALRAVRKRLKEPVGGEDRALALSLRQRVQKIEIDAEHIEQLTLAATLPAPPGRPLAGAAAAAAARANLADYFGLAGAALDAADEAQLQVIVNAAFPEA